jgi:hypothetical protein
MGKLAVSPLPDHRPPFARFFNGDHDVLTFAVKVDRAAITWRLPESKITVLSSALRAFADVVCHGVPQ